MTSKDLKGVIHSDPEIMGGTPVLVGTRVPLQNLQGGMRPFPGMGVLIG
jgi:uncharacterized protein (DUF433 family)